MRRSDLVFALLSLILALAPAIWRPALAGDTPSADDLRAVQQQLSQSIKDRDRLSAQGADLRQHLDALHAQMVQVGADLQEREQAQAEIEARLDLLTRQEQEKEKILDTDRQRLPEVIAALERLAREPPEAVLAMPGSSADVVRGAILLRDLGPRLAVSAASLKTELDGLTTLQADIADQKRRLAGATTLLEQQRAALAALYAQTQQLEKGNEEQRAQTEQHLAALAAQASDLLDLMSRLENDPDAQNGNQKVSMSTRSTGPGPAPSAGEFLPSLDQARGSLLYPAEGLISAAFGQPDASGMPTRGITFDTGPDAEVVAPFAGKVVFAGPFHGYGLLLIIEHGGDYHTLLAGLGRIDCTVGQDVLTGEPVGVMGEDQAKSQLYLEIRHGGQPIDPLPWLSPRKTKVAG